MAGNVNTNVANKKVNPWVIFGAVTAATVGGYAISVAVRAKKNEVDFKTQFQADMLALKSKFTGANGQITDNSNSNGASNGSSGNTI